MAEALTIHSQSNRDKAGRLVDAMLMTAAMNPTNRAQRMAVFHSMA